MYTFYRVLSYCRRGHVLGNGIPGLGDSRPTTVAQQTTVRSLRMVPMALRGRWRRDVRLSAIRRNSKKDHGKGSFYCNLELFVENLVVRVIAENLHDALVYRRKAMYCHEKAASIFDSEIFSA